MKFRIRKTLKRNEKKGGVFLCFRGMKRDKEAKPVKSNQL